VLLRYVLVVCSNSVWDTRVVDLRRTNAESNGTMSVSICGRINGENESFGSSFLGSGKDFLGDGIVGSEVDLLESYLRSAVSGGSNLLHRERGELGWLFVRGQLKCCRYVVFRGGFHTM